MKIVSDAWFSDVFGSPVFRVLPKDVTAEEIRIHAADNPGSFYYAKVPCDDVRTVETLCSSGFYVVDVNVTFRYQGSASHVPDDVRRATPADSDKVLAIAATTFRYSRFHLDHRISNALANEIKRRWIASYIEGQRKGDLWVADDGNGPVGFLAVIGDETGHRIDLIGVDRQNERKGVGRKLTSFFVNFYGRPSHHLDVGTQIANIPSVRLYEGLGFRISESSYVLHKHALK